MPQSPFVRKNRYRNALRANPRTPLEVLQWLDDFQRKLETEPDLNKLLSAFAMLDVKDPAHPTAEAALSEDKVEKWFYYHQREYNTAIWEMIRNAGLLSRLRTAVVGEELLVTWKHPVTGEEDPRFGNVLEKEYAGELYDKFFGRNKHHRGSWIYPRQ